MRWCPLCGVTVRAVDTHEARPLHRSEARRHGVPWAGATVPYDPEAREVVGPLRASPCWQPLPTRGGGWLDERPNVGRRVPRAPGADDIDTPPMRWSR